MIDTIDTSDLSSEGDTGNGNDLIATPKNWERSYRAAESRLWPANPTVDESTLDAWRTQGIRVVLDAGCGDGKNLAVLASKGFFAVGLDGSATALDQCQQYLKNTGHGEPFHLLAATNLDNIPFHDDAVQSAICIDVLGHVKTPQAILQELCRVICHGGYLYASVFHPKDGGFQRSPDHPYGRDMFPLNPDDSNPQEFRYRPVCAVPTGIKTEHYYRYYNEKQAVDLFNSAGFGLVEGTLKARTWHEPPHQGFREYEHEHTSWFGVMRKP